MKFFVVFAVALACAAADVPHLKSPEFAAPIVRQAYDLQPNGDFNYNFETGNGIYAEVNGEVKNPNSENAYVAFQGGYKYTSPEGVPVETSYTADEEGFKPQGSHLPISPEIPAYILRSLAYIASHPPQPEGPRPVAPVTVNKNYGK